MLEHKVTQQILELQKNGHFFFCGAMKNTPVIRCSFFVCSEVLTKWRIY